MARADLPVDIDFSEFQLGTTFVVTTPPTTVEGVQIRGASYVYWADDDLEPEQDLTGIAEIQLAPADFALANGAALHTQRINMVFDFAGAGARIEFDYLDREPRVWDNVLHETYNINLGVQFLWVDAYVPSFSEYATFNFGELDSDINVTETVLPSGDVYGHVELVAHGSYSAFIVGGRDLWIDNLSIVAIPEPATVGLIGAALLLLLRRRYRQ